MQFLTQTQHQTQKQGYYLSMQHMQFMHLLHLSGYALDEYLQNQVEQNPLLEVAEAAEETEAKNEEPETEADKEIQEIYGEEFFEEADVSDYEKNFACNSSDEDIYLAPVVQSETMTEQLKTQVGLMPLKE